MKKLSLKYDAWYDSRTGEWEEVQCSDKMCSYCKGRPKKFPIKKVKKNGKSIKRRNTKRS